jgi:hypothetical protein
MERNSDSMNNDILTQLSGKLNLSSDEVKKTLAEDKERLKAYKKDLVKNILETHKSGKSFEDIYAEMVLSGTEKAMLRVLHSYNVNALLTGILIEEAKKSLEQISTTY